MAGQINQWIMDSGNVLPWRQKVKAGKFALKAARHLDSRLARPAYDAHLLAQKTAQLAANNPKTTAAAVAGVLGSGLLGALAGKMHRDRRRQEGAGLMNGIVTELAPRLDAAAWQARFAAEQALKQLRQNPKLATGAALLAAGAYGLKKKKKQRGSGGKWKRRRVSKHYQRRQKGAGFLRKIPILGNLINMLV